LTPGGSSTVHIYTQYIEQHNRHKQYTEQHNSPIRKSAESVQGIPLAFALQLRKKHGKTSVRVAGECHRTEHICQ